jgi:hypothetical protein
LFFCNSDDEGSEEEEEGDENDYEDEYDEEDDNDEDYEEEEEEGEDDGESPSFFFGNNQIQQQAWNNFQFGTPKTSSAQQESVSGLSSMIANFNVCSPFSFGLQSTIEVIVFFFFQIKYFLFIDTRKSMENIY